MVLIIFCVLLSIPSMLVEALACIPAVANWDPTISGRCVEYRDFWISSMALELALDVVILGFPVREVFKLQMSLKKKLGVSLIFLLGGL